MRLLFCLGCLIFPSVLQHANAERAPSLYQLAANYENSVRNFQDVTKRLRGLNAADRRAITQLLRESRQLRAAAKNPLHRTRLRSEWEDVQRRHVEVQTRIFENYTPSRSLAVAWQSVEYCVAVFDEEYFFDVTRPRHNRSVLRVR